MPVKKQARVSQTTSSYVVTTKITESRSSQSSLKTVTHERSSSGKMLETWPSPSLALTSPQTWVSGTEAKFLSPPKSPSPKRRITRRSSVYVRPGWSGKSKAISSPKGLEFKIPSSSISSLSTTRSRQSSAFQQSSGGTSTSRRSSVYKKSNKAQGGTEIKQEEFEITASKGVKSKVMSPGSKLSKLPFPSRKKSKSKSPSKVTRTRKRNVSEVEKEDSPEKPAAKRSRRADESISASPRKGEKSTKKSSTKQSETSPSPAKASRKRSKSAARSPSPKKGVKSAQRASRKKSRKSSASSGKSATTPVSPKEAELVTSPVTPVKAAKSPVSPKKGAKSPARKGAKSPVRKGAKSPVRKGAKSPVRKGAKSPARAAAKSPARAAAKSPARAAAKSPARGAAKSPSVSPRKAAKSPSPRRARSTKSSSLDRKGRSIRSKGKVEEKKMENSDDDASVESYVVTFKSQKRKRTAKDDSLEQSPKQKAAKLTDTPQQTPKQTKSVTPSPKAKSKSSSAREGGKARSRRRGAKSPSPRKGAKSPASSKKSKSRKAVSRKSSDNEETLTPRSSHTTDVFESVVLDVKLETSSKKEKETKEDSRQKKTPTPVKKVAKDSKQQLETPKSATPSKRRSEKLLMSSTKKTSQKKRGKSESTMETYISITSPGTESKTPSRMSGKQKHRAVETPTSTKKGSASAKSKRGKKTVSKSPLKRSNRSFDGYESKATPKSERKSAKKSVKSNTKNLSSIHQKTIECKTSSERLNSSDSLDGSSLQASAQLKRKSLGNSVSKRAGSAVRSATDEKILEILKKAVSSTPKSSKKLSTPKSSQVSSKSVKRLNKTPVSPRSLLKNHRASESLKKSATTSKETSMSRKSSGSLRTTEASPRKTLGLLKTESAQEKRLSRQNMLTPLSYQSGQSSVSRIRTDSILSRDFVDQSNSNYQLQKYDREAGAVLPSRQGQAYQEEKSFAQYVEYQGNSGVERYGARALEHTVGDQTYRAGSYRTERKRGLETEYEEDEWEDGDRARALKLTDGGDQICRTGRYRTERKRGLEKEAEIEDEGEDGDENSGAERYGARGLKHTVGGQTYQTGRYRTERKRGVETEEEEDGDEDSRVERYEAGGLKRTVGRQTYRTGRYRTERRRGVETEYEEGEWEDGDENNSAVNDGDEIESFDSNASISTSTDSSRCIIL